MCLHCTVRQMKMSICIVTENWSSVTREKKKKMTQFWCCSMHSVKRRLEKSTHNAALQKFFLFMQREFTL